MNNRTDRNDYDFGPFADDYRGYNLEETEGARGPLILALAGGVMLIFGAVIWNTYKAGVRTDAGALPIVYADAEPYKTRPENPGGVVTPDQERRVYDELDGSDRSDADFQTALNSTESEGEGDEILQGGPPINLLPGEETDIDDVTGIPRAVQSQVEALSDLNNVPDAPIETAAATSPTPQASPAALQAPRFAFDASGEYLVQIAALRTQDAADAAWQGALKKLPDIYLGAEKRVQRADLGAKGVFYRLRVGAFGERSEASEFCDALKAKDQTCIVVSG